MSITSLPKKSSFVLNAFLFVLCMKSCDQSVFRLVAFTLKFSSSFLALLCIAGEGRGRESGVARRGGMG